VCKKEYPMRTSLLIFLYFSIWHKICQSKQIQLNNGSKKSNINSMKNLLVALGVLSLTAISCTKSNESLQSNQEEIQSKRRPGPGGGGSGIISSSVPQVTGLSAYASGATSVDLSWNSVTNATSYWIYRGSLVPAIVTSTSFVDRSVTPGTTYSYAVAAVVNSTLGPKSSWVTVTTPQAQ